MKNLLAIEVKDNKTIVTLTKFINGKHNLMHHKSYESKPLSSSVAYDGTIVDKIKKDLSDKKLFDSLDKISLSINTKRVVFHVFDNDFKYNVDLDKEKEIIKKRLEKEHPNLEILRLEFPYKRSGYTKKTINSTVELIESDYLREIIASFKVKGIEITNIIPMMDVIKESMKKNAIDDGITFSILVEEKFTQLTTFENGSISFSTKWNLGLNSVYQHISEKMNVHTNVSKNLFKYFGSIPPENVVDNKIIHTIKTGKEIEVFTKKELSEYITEKVNELFSNVKSKFGFVTNDQKRKIIFSGEIKSLNGFKKYATKSFAEKNINQFSNDEIVGLKPETEFITIGILDNIKNKSNVIKDTFNELDKPKISVVKKFIRMYNYI